MPIYCVDLEKTVYYTFDAIEANSEEEAIAIAKDLAEWNSESFSEMLVTYVAEVEYLEDDEWP